jgi:hypothetical protein
MASSDVEICNLALSHLAIATEIATLTERSKEAQACNRFYAQVRDECSATFRGRSPRRSPPWPSSPTSPASDPAPSGRTHIAIPAIACARGGS